MTDRSFITVIMPIRNEADFIARSLSAVLAQDYPHDRMELLIADGMSTDNTRAEIARVAKTADFPIVVLDNPKAIVPAGMNIAMKRARGEIIVRVDGHCEIAPDYVSRCVEHLQSGEADGVGGPIETIGNSPLAKTIALAMSTPFGVGGSAFRTVKDRSMYVDTIAFPAYLRTVVDKAGPYDEQLVRNQDDEYNYRLRSLGFRLLLAQDIRSDYYSRGSFKSLWRQYFQYGMFKVLVMKKHPRQMSLRQFTPPLFVASLVSGALLAPFFKPVRRLWLVMVALYALGNLAASVTVARKNGPQHLSRLPPIFAILHLGYGAGFLVGLYRFGLRRLSPPQQR